MGTVSSGNVVYIPVIHQDGSGDLTGRLYRVPEPLTLQEFNSVEPSVSQNTQEETAYYSDTLSLSDCELLEGKAVTEKFAYTIGPGTHVYKVSELTPFNDKGNCVVGIGSNADGGFLGVLHRDANGSLFERVYRVPDR